MLMPWNPLLCGCTAECQVVEVAQCICTSLCPFNSQVIPHRLERSTACNLTLIQTTLIILNQTKRILLRLHINKEGNMFNLHIKGNKDNQYHPINTEISLYQ